MIPDSHVFLKPPHIHSDTYMTQHIIYLSVQMQTCITINKSIIKDKLADTLSGGGYELSGNKSLL